MTDHEKMNLPIPLSVLNSYGPFAFGTIVAVTLWFSMMKPELDSRKLDFAAQQSVMASMVSQVQTQESIIIAMDRTAQTLSLTAQILERTVEKLDKQDDKQRNASSGQNN